MKYLVVLVVVLGFACGSEEEDLGLQGLVDIEDDFTDIPSGGRQATIDPMLIIGNIIGALGSLNLTDPNSIVGDILDALKITGGVVGGTAATVGGLGAITGIKSLIEVFIAGILGLIAVPVGIANMILSLVGLVVLIIFLIDGGDFGSLLGVARSLPTAWIPEFPTFDLVNNPLVDTVSDMFFKAMEKYD